MQCWRKSSDEGSSHLNRVGEWWRQISEDKPSSDIFGQARAVHVEMQTD
jgi:hypothetical protein